MKLERFRERNNKRIGIIVFTIICILLITGVILYRTFAIFESNGEFNVINGEVQDMGDIQFAFYIDNNIVKYAPKKEEKEKYVFDEENSNCTNAATVYWDYQQWAPTVLNLTETKTKCYLKFKTEYNEEILNGAVPKLKDELTPITIDDGGTVKKADTTTNWYNYGEQRWANAIILKDDVVDNYQPGDEIKEKDIESYFVWIPRYKYQLWNGEEETSQFTETQNLGTIENATTRDELNKQKEIKIEFENKHIPVSNGNLKNQWLTHPAFTSFDVNGMWVGKFETGYNGATSIVDAQHNETDSTKVIIKPNVYSWRGIQVANAFYTSLNYQKSLQSHMMKNMEWGAVFYLTQSKYGLCKDGTCNEPRINNNSKYVTGFSANKEPTCGWTSTDETCNKRETKADLNADGDNGWSYCNPKSVVASTTGNYYGIYDMVGGAWEYVMGVIKSSTSSVHPQQELIQQIIQDLKDLILVEVVQMKMD